MVADTKTNGSVVHADDPDGARERALAAELREHAVGQRETLPSEHR